MLIWDKSPRTIVSLLLSSTAHKFYFSEIVECTGLARGTVSSILQRLQAADIVVREEERFKYDSPFRAPRVYYSLDPRSFHHVRLQAPST
jgi:DNA-binding IclR family transcriptional regulator